MVTGGDTDTEVQTLYRHRGTDVIQTQRYRRYTDTEVQTLRKIKGGQPMLSQGLNRA